MQLRRHCWCWPATWIFLAFIYLFIYLFIYYLFIYLFIYVFIYSFMPAGDVTDDFPSFIYLFIIIRCRRGGLIQLYFNGVYLFRILFDSRWNLGRNSAPRFDEFVVALLDEVTFLEDVQAEVKSRPFLLDDPVELLPLNVEIRWLCFNWSKRSNRKWNICRSNPVRKWNRCRKMGKFSGFDARGLRDATGS